ncbi:hypothetical protein WA026_012645 [Henosepilachna vigintioctopunctata]|uniref:Uncharacterized protein n=1 Tax=Henosepilachna vigintioctopunctata TaxID=420089 RepID=A0AAW1U6Q7_9CUCU
MHQDSQMHIRKSDYEFLGHYEIVYCLENGRYDIKKVGTNIMTKAAKEQLRRWPAQWPVSCDMNAILEFLEKEDDVEVEKAAVSAESVTAVRLAVLESQRDDS